MTTTRKKAYNNIYFVDLMSYMLLYVVLIYYYNDFYNSYRNNYDIYVKSYYGDLLLLSIMKDLHVDS